MKGKAKFAGVSSSRNAPPAWQRGYRRSPAHAGEVSFQVVVAQTDLWITARAEDAAPLTEKAMQTVTELRGSLQSWMLLDQPFAGSLTPRNAPAHAPFLVREMSRATALFGVGPMAAVAGGIAALVAEALLPYASDIIVENGGDSMLYSTRERVIGLLPDPASNAVVGIRIPKEEFPVSLCASSSTIGHSLSFGAGELAVVRANNAFIADAAATALCNQLQTPEDLQRVADLAATFAHTGVQGVFLQCGGAIGIWGNMELVAL